MKFEVRPSPLRGYEVGFYYQEGIRQRWTIYSTHATQETAETQADYYNQVFPERRIEQTKPITK